MEDEYAMDHPRESDVFHKGGDNTRVVHNGHDDENADSTGQDPFRPSSQPEDEDPFAQAGHADGEHQEDEDEGGHHEEDDGHNGNPLSAQGSSRKTSNKSQSSLSRHATAPIGESNENAGMRRGTMGSLRRKSTLGGSNLQRKSTITSDSNGRSGSTGQVLQKRATLASMMLSGDTGAPPDADAAHDEEHEESEDLGYTTADRMEAEQIFMPNMRREKYIPVRIARDKIKQVLSEMAQLKNMHYAALETMEQQHVFLKAQLDATVATYARKLTNDYNERVSGLEKEYQRRLDNLNNTALGDLKSTLDAAKRDASKSESQLMAKMEQREAEMESEKKLFQTLVDNEKKELAKQQEAVANHEAQLVEARREADDLRVQLRVAQNAQNSSATPDAGQAAQHEEELRQLRSQLEDARGDATQLRQENAELADAVAAGGQQEDAPGDAQEGQQILVGGDDDEEEGEQIEVGGGDEDDIQDEDL
jgi:hypothetical protein